MWSGPPYCETKDLMNRIRKLHFKHSSKSTLESGSNEGREEDEEEFDNYMTI